MARPSRRPDDEQAPGRAAGARPEEAGEPEAAVDESRGVFMISVAAELAEMHPQTLRMYESRGLIMPQRSPKNTRLYSHADVERLRRIQRMTTEGGLNLAGVETVLELESRLEEMRDQMARMRERADRLERELMEEVKRVRRSFKAELVPYGAYRTELGGAGVTIPIKRRPRRRGPGEGA